MAEFAVRLKLLQKVEENLSALSCHYCSEDLRGHSHTSLASAKSCAMCSIVVCSGCQKPRSPQPPDSTQERNIWPAGLQQRLRASLLKYQGLRNLQVVPKIVEKCPECESTEYSNVNVPPEWLTLLKSLIQELPKRCPFQKYGCQEVLMESDLEKHEERCLFFEISCASFNCREKFGAPFYLEHFEKVHKHFEVIGQCDASFTIQVGYDRDNQSLLGFPRKLSAFNRTFFVTGRAWKYAFQIFVMLLGTEDDAEEFQAVISVPSSEKLRFNAYNFDVYSMTLSLEEMVDKSKYYFTLFQLFDMSKDISRIEFKLKLHKWDDQALHEDEPGVIKRARFY